MLKNKETVIKHLEIQKQSEKFEPDFFNNKKYDGFRNYKEVVIEAVKQNGFILNCASDRLKDDKEVVIQSVKQDGWALRFASENLKDDKEVVLEAVKQNGRVLDNASQEINELCKDRNPKETLEKAISYDKLKTQLKPKADEKPAQKLKI